MTNNIMYIRLLTTIRK